MLTALYPLLRRLLQALVQSSSPATVAVRLQWRLVNAELGLAAWVAYAPSQQESDRPGASALIASLDPDSEQAPRELARALAVAHPGQWVVAPLWTPARLSAAGIPPEVALHCVLQNLRLDTPIGAAAPTLLTTAATRDWCRRYASLFHAHTRPCPPLHAAPSSSWAPDGLALAQS